VTAWQGQLLSDNSCHKRAYKAYANYNMDAALSYRQLLLINLLGKRKKMNRFKEILKKASVWQVFWMIDRIKDIAGQKPFFLWSGWY